MKKLMAIICTVAMLLSFATTAFAAESVLYQTATEYEAQAEYWMELNKPLDILSYITEAMFMETDLTKVDMQYLIESVLKSKMTVDVKAEANPENLKQAKVEMKINFNIPANISEDIKTTSDLTAYLWMDLDITSEENAKYLVVVKNPLNGKYLYLDLFDEEVFGKETVAELKKILVETANSIDTTTYTVDMTKLIEDVYSKNATITEKGYTTTITFTNNSFVDAIFDVLTGTASIEVLKEALSTSNLVIDDNQIAMVKTLVKGLGIFSDNDAVVETVTTDRNGKIKEATSKIHLDFNIVELCEAFGMTEASLYPVTRDKANIDVTFNSKTVYEKFNENVIFTIPTLTEENSVNILKLIMDSVNDSLYDSTGNDYDYDYSYDIEEYQPVEFYNYSSGVMNRNMYVSVEEFLMSTVSDGDNLKIEEQTVTKDDKEVIQLVISSDYMAPVVVEGSTEGFSYTINGEEVRGGAAFTYVQGYDWETYEAKPMLCVNVNILQEVLDCKLESVTMYYIDYNTGNTLETPTCEFWFYRKNPAYVPAE